MKRKVLFVITKSNWGGAQRYVFDLVSHLSDEWEPVVALGGTGEKGAGAGMLAERLREAGVRTISVQSFMRDLSWTRDVRLVPELWHIMREEHPDVVHLNSSKAGAAGALAARLARIQQIVFTSHGLVYDEDRNALWRVGALLATWATFLLCHRVIAISKDTARRTRRFPLCRRKVYLIYNGTPATSFVDVPEARRALSLPDEMAVIGTVAELTRNKGLSYLVEAAGILKRGGALFRLCIVGSGEEEGALKALTAQEGLAECVVFAGFVPRASRYLKAFDIFALPSVKEGLPYVLMEAGQAGVSVVASRIPGITDMIDDSINGLLVEPRRPSALAEALGKLLSDPALGARLGTALRKKIADDFSLEKMVRETAALYTRS